MPYWNLWNHCFTGSLSIALAVQAVGNRCTLCQVSESESVMVLSWFPQVIDSVPSFLHLYWVKLGRVLNGQLRMVEKYRSLVQFEWLGFSSADFVIDSHDLILFSLNRIKSRLELHPRFIIAMKSPSISAAPRQKKLQITPRNDTSSVSSYQMAVNICSKPKTTKRWVDGLENCKMSPPLKPALVPRGLRRYRRTPERMNRNDAASLLWKRSKEKNDNNKQNKQTDK